MKEISKRAREYEYAFIKDRKKLTHVEILLAYQAGAIEQYDIDLTDRKAERDFAREHERESAYMYILNHWGKEKAEQYREDMMV